MTKFKQISPILNLFFKILIVAGSAAYLVYIIFYKEKHYEFENGDKIDVTLSFIKDFLFEQFINEPWKILWLLGAMLLTTFNWGVEMIKFKMLVGLFRPVSNKLAFRSIMSSITAGVSTPYKVGSYFARVAHLPSKQRLKGMAHLFIGDTSQLSCTILLGTVSVFFMVLRSPDDLMVFNYQKDFLLWLSLACASGTLVFIYIFFKLDRFLRFLKWLKINTNVQNLWKMITNEKHKSILARLYVLNIFRLSIIFAQYFLLFNLFGLEVSYMDSFLVTSSLLMLYNLLPTFNLIEMGMARTGIYLILLEAFVDPELLSLNNTLVVSCTLFLIWLINLALPALVGSVQLLRIKLFHHE